jgi:type I restriction enzyme, R subunit
MVDTSERDFEASIEATLLHDLFNTGQQNALALAETPAGAYFSGGYQRQEPTDYDKALCLIPKDALDFIYATQPKEWQKMQAQHGHEAKAMVLNRLASEITKHGTLHVLRKGIKANGCKFRLAHFKPSSGLNEASQKLYRANLFSVVRQLRYSEKNEKSLDTALFLNGLPLFTAELKNPFKGQNVQDAVRQYRLDRDPKEPLFAFGRCLAHFAVDPALVYVTTALSGPKTVFLPFNQGYNLGAGNPPSWKGFSTAYLWEQVWAKDSILNLLQHFIHIVELEDDKGNKTGERRLLFPRYHQLDCVRRLVVDALARGVGQCDLVQHSAGSGKSNTIAWLAHQLSILHDTKDKRVFDSIIVVTDRRVLDRQLQRTVRQFEQTLGVVETDAVALLDSLLIVTEIHLSCVPPPGSDDDWSTSVNHPHHLGQQKRMNVMVIGLPADRDPGVLQPVAAILQPAFISRPTFFPLLPRPLLTFPNRFDHFERRVNCQWSSECDQPFLESC